MREGKITPIVLKNRTLTSIDNGINNEEKEKMKKESLQRL